MAWDWRVDADLGGSIGTLDLAPWMREWSLVAGKNTGSSFGSYGIPAVLEIQLENEDGRFSRTNPASPYAMHLNGGGLVDMHIPDEGRLIRARLAPFRAQGSRGRSLAKLTAYGALRELQTSEGSVPPMEEIRTDLLVQYILRKSGILNRYIYLNPGTQTMPYFWGERGRNFDIVQGPVFYEGGALLDHRDYGIVFEPRNWRTTAPNDEILARLGTGGYRVASFDDGDEFDVVINSATVPYHSYNPGATRTLYDWTGNLPIPAYGFLLTEAGGYLLQEDGGKLIVQAPVEQEFRVEISSDTESAVDWSECTLSVTASVGDISAQCRLVGLSPTEALVSIPRRSSSYTVTAIRVTGPIIARDVAGQARFRDPISIRELGAEYDPETVPSWHDDRLEARQLAVDYVIGFKSQGLVAKVGFWLRGRAAGAWRRWISDAVAVDLITRERVRIASNGVIEQIALSQRIGDDPYCEWLLSGLYRELPDSTTVVMAPINDVNLVAGTRLGVTLPEAKGGSGSFSYFLAGNPDWISRSGFLLSGIAPASIGSDTLTWSATDTSSGTTISRSFTVARTGIVLGAPIGFRATDILNRQLRLRWNSVSNATRYEYRYARGSEAPTGDWTDAGTATSVLITGLSWPVQYTFQVRAVGTVPYLTSPARQISASTIPAYVISDAPQVSIQGLGSIQPGYIRIILAKGTGGKPSNLPATATWGLQWQKRRGTRTSVGAPWSLPDLDPNGWTDVNIGDFVFTETGLDQWIEVYREPDTVYNRLVGFFASVRFVSNAAATPGPIDTYEYA